MTEEDLSRIEDALSVRLPDVYRRQLSPFPIPSESGNTDTQVWDDAGALIAVNQRVRAEVEGWPNWLFVIGQSEGDPCGYAIDARSPECPVWWLEQMRPWPPSGPTQGPFVVWFSQWAADQSSNGISGRSCLRLFLTWLLLAVTGVVAYWVWAARRIFRGR
jgi:hypothetical protein